MEEDKVLENFMKEFFDFNMLLKAGFFTKKMKRNYKAQADKVCHFFGYKTVYEYGSREINCHISFADKRPLVVNHLGELTEEPFMSTIPSIY